MNDQLNKLSNVTGAVDEAKKHWKVHCKNQDCVYKMDFIKDASRYFSGEPTAWACPECSWTTEEEDNPTIDMTEMTTSADVAFAPQMGFREPTQQELNRLGFPKYKKNKPATKEAVMAAEDVGTLKDAILKEFRTLVNKTRLHIDEFTKAFPRNNDATPTSVLLGAARFPDDLDRLYKLLPEDAGELELIKNALKDRRPIQPYNELSAFNNLYGCRLATRHNGISIIYEATINNNYLESETLLVDDVDAIHEIKSQVKSVRVGNRLLFPVGGLFEKGIINKVKTIIGTELPVKQEIGGSK